MKIGIQGEIDSFSHKAAQTVFGEGVSVSCNKDFNDCFKGLDKRETKYIVVPIENSTFGSIYENYDNITRYGVSIVGEVYIKVSLGILCCGGSDISSIKKVYSHPIALMQINNFKERHPNIEFVPYTDTAKAVDHILDKKDKTLAACAGVYIQREGLERVENHIEDNKKNYTRFLVLSKDKEEIKHKNSKDIHKTSVVFCLGEEAGSLAKVLTAFAENDIALSHIQSRPILDSHWEYRFYVDAIVKSDEDRFKKAVEQAKPFLHNKTISILGSYDCGESIVIE